jgi:protein-tyrosine-phosphatase
MNQARSPFAQAVLERNFPDDQISSTGVRGIVDTPVMEMVASIAKEWNMPISKKYSTNLEVDKDEILSADLIICAEDAHCAAITALGYTGALISYEKILEDKDFIPQDPDGFSPENMRRELGKVAALTLRAVLDHKKITNRHPVLAVIPHGISDLEMALTHAQFERKLRGAVLIDADLRAPLHQELLELGIQKIEFDVSHAFSSNPVMPNENEALSHSHQIDDPERFFLDPLWRDFIASYSNQGPVVLLTAPRHSRMRRLPDSYLSSLQADEFSVISS